MHAYRAGLLYHSVIKMMNWFRCFVFMSRPGFLLLQVLMVCSIRTVANIFGDFVTAHVFQRTFIRALAFLYESWFEANRTFCLKHRLTFLFVSDHQTCSFPCLFIDVEEYRFLIVQYYFKVLARHSTSACILHLLRSKWSSYPIFVYRENNIQLPYMFVDTVCWSLVMAADLFFGISDALCCSVETAHAAQWYFSRR